MERYFIVTEESELHKDWFEYKENRSRVRELIHEFNQANNIESESYFVTDTAFYIVPTDKDKENFGQVLALPINDGLQKFKGNSKVAKAWVKTLKEAGIRIKHKPRLIFYISPEGGRYRSRLFEIDGIVYCSIDPCQEKTPHGFKEIKASEFFKVIEDAEKATA